MYKKILLALLLASSFTKAQNLLINNSFETGNLSYPDCYTASDVTDIFSHLDFWDSRYLYHTCTPGGWPSHSPDWFECANGGWDGNCKVVIRAYELATQNFGERLIDQDCYTVRMKISPNSGYDSDTHTDDWDNFEVVVYLSRGELFYTDEDIVDDDVCYDPPTDEDYCSLTQHFAYDDYVKVGSFDIMPAENAEMLNNTIGDWFDFVMDFKADFQYDANYYNWFTFDVRRKYGYGAPYSRDFQSNYDFVEMFPSCPKDYSIDGVHLAGSQTTYKCREALLAGNIYKGSVVLEYNAHSEFQAGNVIDLIPGFSTEPGATLDAHIQACAGCRDGGRKAGNNPRVLNTTFDPPLKVIPNPATDFVKVESNLPLNHIEIINMDGKVLLTQEGKAEMNARIDLGNLPTGVYIVKVLMTNGSVETCKLLKIE